MKIIKSTILLIFLMSVIGSTYANNNNQGHEQCLHEKSERIQNFETKLKTQILKQLDDMARKRGLALCWAPGTPNSKLKQINTSLANSDLPVINSLASESRPGGNARFEIGPGGRWESTAVDGSLNVGTCFTLTWSFVPDGTPIGGFLTDPDIPNDPTDVISPSTLVAEMDAIYGCTSTSDLTQSCWFDLFQSVFDDWESRTGISYLYEPNDDGAQIDNSGPPFLTDGAVGVRGDCRIGAHPVDGDFGTLAYNFFPGPFDVGGGTIIQGGDMVIDLPDAFYTTNNPTPFDQDNSARFRAVVAHEHGHGLGLSHSCPLDNQSKLMEPFAIFNPVNGSPKLDDILGAQALYGDPFCEAIDAISKATVEGDGTPQFFEGLSVEPLGGDDVYEFSIGLPCEIEVLIDPVVGDAYLAGPQDGSVPGDPADCSAGTLFDPNTQANLDLEIVGPTGSVAISNTNAAGIAESISVFLPTAGIYRIVVSNNGEESIQAYSMTCNISNCAAPDAIPTMGEWGLICLSVCLLIFGIIAIRETEYKTEKVT